MNEDTQNKKRDKQDAESNAPQREIQSHLTEIYERSGSSQLSPAAAHFAKTTAVGRREVRISRGIASGVEDLPRLSVPARLRALVLDRLRGPAYRWYHIAAAVMFAGLSPIVFQHAQVNGVLTINSTWLPWVFFFFGLLNLMLVVPLAFHILLNRRDDIEELGRSFDDYLEHPSRLFSRFRG